MQNPYSLSEVLSAIDNHETSLENLVRQYLDIIEDYKWTNAYVRVYAEEALSKARSLDEKYQADPGSVGKLFGLVVSIKDNICYAGRPVTAGSKILEGYETPFHATVIERILAEDAVVIGAVNCDEFGMGSSSEYSKYGHVEQGKHPGYIPGGSSGGSAVAVQTGTCLISLGSDTGGSIRQPAAMTGILGFKPGYGKISRYGLIAYASSFDQIGILGRNVDDIAVVLEVIAGLDHHDSSASLAKVDAYSDAYPQEGKRWRFGVLHEALAYPGLDADILSAFKDFVDVISNENQVETTHFKLLDFVVPAYYILAMAEASSNLARYDGVRYGYRDASQSEFREMVLESRTKGFGIEVKRRIMGGTFVLSAGYYDKYFGQAQKVRRLIKKELEDILQSVDALLLPSIPITSWKCGEKLDDPVSVYLSDVYTVIANLAGLPAASIPLGENSEGFDFGLQILTGRNTEHMLLQIIRDFDKYLPVNK